MQVGMYLGAVVGVLFLFLLSRALMLWYWEVDEVLKELRLIRQAIEKQAPIAPKPPDSPPQ
jgi:hypothetical protein